MRRNKVLSRLQELAAKGFVASINCYVQGDDVEFNVSLFKQRMLDKLEVNAKVPRLKNELAAADPAEAAILAAIDDIESKIR